MIYYEYFPSKSSKIPIVIVHGLFGSTRNFRPLARLFQDYHPVFLLDLCNHGKSHRIKQLSLQHLMEHVYGFLKEHNIFSCYRIGHSLGGKVMMLIDLFYRDFFRHPSFILDIAPINYPYDHYLSYLSELKKMDLSLFKERSYIEQHVKSFIDNDRLVAAFLQNLTRDNNLKFQFVCHYEYLYHSIKDLCSFPEINLKSFYPIHFIRGAYSSYIPEDHFMTIRDFFPYATIETLELDHFMNLHPKVIFKSIMNRLG